MTPTPTPAEQAAVDYAKSIGCCGDGRTIVGRQAFLAGVAWQAGRQSEAVARLVEAAQRIVDAIGRQAKTMREQGQRSGLSISVIAARNRLREALAAAVDAVEREK